MMKLVVLSAFALVTLSFLASCSKGTNGCTDATASNYSSTATINNGTCIYTGNVAFWTPNLSLHHGTITVTLDNGQATTITVNNTQAQPCESTIDGAIMSVPTGTHKYTTKDGFGITASPGSVVVETNGCTQQILN